MRMQTIHRILGQPEIDQANFSILAEHDIFRFYISVSDTERVAVLQSLEQIQNDLRGLSFGVRLTAFEAFFMGVEELSSRA